MKITLITCSKQSSKEISILCDQYLTRIIRFAKIDHINIKPSSHKDLTKRRVEDTTKMYAKVSKQGFVICCDEKGKRYSSKTFANHINQAFHHASHIFFMIGPANGFAPEIIQQDNLLMLSDMTLQHEHVQLILLEQIYRAFTLLNNHPYHIE